MTDITLTDTQYDAVKRTVAWYRAFKAGETTQQIWRVFGYAGVGKTTILKLALQELQNSNDGCHWLAMAYTGKASLVMTRKGTPASTIHSAIYRVTEATKEAIEEARKKLVDLLQAGAPADQTQLFWRAQVRDLELQIKNMHRPSFIINEESPIVDADLIVLDEVSMVNEEMAADLMSFGKPILVLGDPGQLPPIKGEGAFTQATPDVMLTEIHRQAADSAIIRLATMAREGRQVPFGRYSDLVMKISRRDFPQEWLLGADQVICGYNATRLGLNNWMRQASGFPDALPSGGDEKLICLKNNKETGVVNGQFIKLAKIDKINDLGFAAHVLTEEGQNLGKRTVYRGHFDDHVAFDKSRGERDHWHKRGMIEAVWGWCITCHKAQGSGWNNVIVYDDGFGRGDDRARWLYTAITRAESGLLILG
jgi:exodeoxyribonuclease-5